MAFLNKGIQPIRQLEARQGGYFFLEIEAATVDGFPNQRKTRLVCTLDERVSFQCGLNHLGDGNYYIILAKRHLITLQKKLGDSLDYELHEDPNPLGVAIPEVLSVFLEQDALANDQFERMLPGKKRNLIHSIGKIKDMDKQIMMIRKLLLESSG